MWTLPTKCTVVRGDRIDSGGKHEISVSIKDGMAKTRNGVYCVTARNSVSRRKLNKKWADKELPGRAEKWGRGGAGGGGKPLLLKGKETSREKRCAATKCAAAN